MIHFGFGDVNGKVSWSGQPHPQAGNGTGGGKEGDLEVASARGGL